MNPFIIGIPAFIGCSFLGYLVREYSVGKLTAEQLGALSVNMRPTRLLYLWSMLAAMGVFLVLRFSMPSLQNVWFLLFLGVTVILTIALEIRGWQRSDLNRFQRAFVMPYVTSRVITLFGTLMLIGAMAATVFMPKA